MPKLRYQSGGYSRYAEPHDNVPKSVRDDRQGREVEVKARASEPYGRAKKLTRALMKETLKRPRHDFNVTAGQALGVFLQQSVTATRKGKSTFWLSNKNLGQKLGKSSRTATTARGKLERQGLIHVSAYPKGGRNSKKGVGYAKEYHVIDFAELADGLQCLGYRLPQQAKEALAWLATWQRNKRETMHRGETN